MQLIIFGECSSKVIFLGGVEIKLVDFWGSVVPFHKKIGGGIIFHLKSSSYLFQKNGGIAIFEKGGGHIHMTELWGKG